MAAEGVNGSIQGKECRGFAPDILSVIVPIRDEVESLPGLHDEIVDTLDGTGYSWEIIYVDDGSEDASWQWINSVRQASRVIGLRLPHRTGKTAALWKGFEVARGDVLVTLDADGQDVPAEIPALLGKIEAGADFVSGWRRDRSDSVLKCWFSRTANGLIRIATDLPLHDMNCGLKAFRRAVIQGLRPVGEAHRSLPILAHWRGFDVREVAVRHRPRREGRTKYGVTRLLGLAVDLGILATYYLWATRPRAFCGWTGALSIFLGVGINLYLTVIWLLGGSLSNRSLLVLGVLLIVVGLQMVMLGFIGQRIADVQLPLAETSSLDRQNVRGQTPLTGDARPSSKPRRRRHRKRAFPRRRSRGSS